MNTALVLNDGDLSLIKKPIPCVQDANDVVVKVSFCGICGTDLSIIAKEFPAASKVIMGHEFAGTVTEVGSNVRHLNVGDRVCVNPTNSCGTCYYCTRGDPQFCIIEAMHTAHGFYKDGGFQEYCLISSTLCFKIPPSMSLRQAIFCQPMSEVCRGWENMAHYESDSRILVCGAGLIGLFWASLFHFHGYRDVTITETSKVRRDNAGKLHMGYPCVHPKVIREEVERASESKDQTWGFDIIVDCTGDPNAVEFELRWARKGCTIVLFGVCPEGATVDFEPFDVYAKEIKIIHSYLNKFTFPRTIKLVNDMTEKYLRWDALGVKTFSIDSHEKAFSALEKGEISKAVFEF